MLQGWTFSIEKQNISREGSKLMILHTILKEMRYYGTKQLAKLMPNPKPEMDCKIQKTAFGEYFLIIPYTCHQKKEKNKSIEYGNPVAVDPGVRKFLTTYAPNSQESFFLGNRWSTRIMSHLLTLDKLYSDLAKEKDHNTKKKLTAKTMRLRKHVFNLKKEMRDQCANFLSTRYDVVMMPKLESGTMCIKANRRLRTKTVRSLMSACHAKFFDTLKDKCWENGTKFLHVREEYTSQTCPFCGALNKCDEVYKCKECSFSQDRDIVGALNIMLKGVRERNPSV
jgi:putative transposase